MSTNALFDKLKSNKDILSSIRAQTESLGPLFSVVSAILRTKSLVDGGIDPSFSELLLPHLVTSFGPSLLANSIYQKFKLSQNDLMIYSIGFVISLFVQSNRFIMFFAKEVPYVSQFFSLVKLKKTTENIFHVLSWTITKEIAGICLNRLVLRKKLKIKAEELLSIFVVYGGVLLLRKYDLNDYYVIVVANLVPLLSRSIECLKKCKMCQEKKVVEEPERRKTRRKASVAAKMEKSK